MTSNGASNVNLSNGSSSVSSSSISPPLQVSIDWEVKYNTLLSKSKQFATTAKGKREALEGELREIKGKTKTFIMEQRKRREELEGMVESRDSEIVSYKAKAFQSADEISRLKLFLEGVNEEFKDFKKVANETEGGLKKKVEELGNGTCRLGLSFSGL
ncbi:hypothetical protein TrCOL_g1925 [Triparma columacea]|uniref:Uncharacterized protein n=2 Tax=Triparma columacea TaxID=722753 RepID=A0A9W7L6Z2_9STRA|nr:hypothetical protein TrCOL_g1925 [Triparma columacea]